MKNIEKISEQYGPLFMRKRQYLSWRGPIICKIIQDILKPESVLDLGCAHGDFVKGFLDLGVSAYGVEGSIYAKDFIKFNVSKLFVRDLCEPIVSVPKCDLVLCIEVLSIINSEFHTLIINNIKNLGRRVILGVGEDKRFGVEKKMEEAGFTRCFDIEEKIKEQLDKWKRKAAVKAFYYGMMYFDISLQSNCPKF